MSLLATRTQNLRASSPNLYSWEDRATEVGALEYFLKDSNVQGGVLTTELKDLALRSIGSTLEAPVLKFDSGVTISNARSVTIADALNTSAMYTFTFVVYSWGWTETPTAHLNNEIKLQEDWNFNYKKHLHAFLKMADTACISRLSSYKTQVFGDLLTYTNNSNMVTAVKADEFQLFADVGPIQHSNDIGGHLNFIGNPGFMSLVNRMAGFDIYNQENKMIQIQNRTLYFTNRIANGVDMGATYYAVPTGSTGILFRHEPEALIGGKYAGNYEFGMDRLVGMEDIPISTYYYEGVLDVSGDHGAASAHNTRAGKRYYGFSVDMCYVTPYNSDPTTIPSPILGLQISKV